VSITYTKGIDYTKLLVAVTVAVAIKGYFVTLLLLTYLRGSSLEISLNLIDEISKF